MVWGQVDAFRWHAICTAQITSFGNAYAEVIVEAIVRVSEEGTE